MDDEQVSRMSVLADPVRRSLFRYVTRRPGPVSRDEAARAVGIQRPLAAHHLDRLVGAGLLEVGYRPPARRSRLSSPERAVIVPPRRYALAGRLLAEAIVEAHSGPVTPAIDDVATRAGRRFADEVRQQAGPRPSRAALRRAVLSVLADH